MYEKQGGHVRNKQIKFHIFIEFGCSDIIDFFKFYYWPIQIKVSGFNFGYLFTLITIRSVKIVGITYFKISIKQY